MKIWILKLLKKVRLQLERYGFKSPAWMFRGSNQIKRWIGVIKPGQRPIVPDGQVIQISPEQQALDSAYLDSLHGASSILPNAGTHLMVDLRVAQVDRERGIPRYAQTLVIELARHCPNIRYSWLIEDGDMPLLKQSLAQYGQFVRVEDISLLPRITHYLQSCMLDRSREATVLFPASLAVHQPQLGALFYDMIPWVFPQFYLRDPTTANGYMRAAELLPALDRLFAISECSRIDAVAFGCDPKRVTTIYGGWDPDRFKSAPAVPPALPAGYWLYIGGDDPRKNIQWLLQAFAKVRQRMPNAPALGDLE